MAKKKTEVSFSGFSGLESGLREFIEKVVNERSEKLTQEEMLEIIKVLLPDLDRLISEKIKKHLVQISKLLIEKLKPEGE